MGKDTETSRLPTSGPLKHVNIDTLISQLHKIALPQSDRTAKRVQIDRMISRGSIVNQLKIVGTQFTSGWDGGGKIRARGMAWRYVPNGLFWDCDMACAPLQLNLLRGVSLGVWFAGMACDFWDLHVIDGITF